MVVQAVFSCADFGWWGWIWLRGCRVCTIYGAAELLVCYMEASIAHGWTT